MKIERPSREALIRYYRGQCLPGEERLIALFLSMDIDHEYTESCLKEAWEDLNAEPPTFLTEERQKSAWQKFQFKKVNIKQLPAKRTSRWYGYAASIALVLVGILALIYFKTGRTDKVHFEHFAAALGKSQEIRLRDSSTVTLFPGSSIDIPDDFNKNDRRIKLTGRAFFQVSHNVDKPFYVSAAELTTKVLGTSFEINSLNATGENTITLHTGKVSISCADKEIARLSPNQQMRFQKSSGKYDVVEIQSANTLQWMMNELDYEQAPLGNILYDLEKWYGVTIHTKSQSLLNRKITISIKDLPINNALTMLSKSAGFSFTVTGNQIMLKEEKGGIQ